MADNRRRKSAKRRKKRHSGLYLTLAVLLTAAAVAAACTVFFRVSDVVVQGNARYTAQEIIDISGVEKGDNLVTLGTSAISGRLRGRLPYIRAVTVRRKLPDTVLITVTEGKAVAAVAQEGQWWLIDEDCKLLERASATGGLATVSGVDPLVPAEGTYLAAGEEQSGRVDRLRELLGALAGSGLLDGLTSVELGEDYQVTFGYQGRFTVHLSAMTEAGMDYWVRRFATAVADPRVDANQNYTVEIMDEQSIRFIPN